MNKIITGYGMENSLYEIIEKESRYTDFKAFNCYEASHKTLSKLTTGVDEIDKLLESIIPRISIFMENGLYNKFIPLIYYIQNHEEELDNKTLAFLEIEHNLHPADQLIFVEILCILIKEFNTSIYTTTNSPYVIESFEVYSAKYDIEDKFKYYVSDEIGIMEDHTDDLENVYLPLACPLQKLEDDENDIYFYDSDDE